MQSSLLTINKGFGCWELVLAAMGFDEIEFILLYTPLIFGYICILFVLFLNLLVSTMIATLVQKQFLFMVARPRWYKAMGLNMLFSNKQHYHCLGPYWTYEFFALNQTQ